jgi:pimeloyl-ACP methyl ester carboxylesterase
MVVWAAGGFPKGWLQGAMTRYEAPLGRSLAVFTHELGTEIRRRLGSHPQVRVVVAGHSLGGAVVGTAERYGLDADAVLHVASAAWGMCVTRTTIRTRPVPATP